MIQDTTQAQQNLAEQKDRITQLLTRQAGNQSFGQDVGDISQSLLSALSQNTGAAGFQQAQSNIRNQRNEAQGNLYKIMQDEVSQGNEDAAHVDKAIKDITGSDIQGYEKIADVIHKMPEKVGAVNANMMAIRAANSLGYKSRMNKDEAETKLKNAQANYYNQRSASESMKPGRNSNIDPILARQVDKDIIVKNRESADIANNSLRALQRLKNIYFDKEGKPKVSTGRGMATLQAVGQYVPFVDSTDYQDVEAITTELGLNVSSMLKGQTSDKDVSRSLTTTPSYKNGPEANKRIIQNKEAALTVVAEMPKFISAWRNAYGSTLGENDNGSTFDEAFLDWQKKRFKEMGGTSEEGSGRYTFNPNTGEVE